VSDETPKKQDAKKTAPTPEASKQPAPATPKSTVGSNALEGVPDVVNVIHENVVRKRYQAVLHPDCPLPVASFGKVTFHRQTYSWSDETAEAVQHYRAGQVVELTDEEVRLVRADIQTRVVRPYWVKDSKGRKIPGERAAADEVACWDGNPATWPLGDERPSRTYVFTGAIDVAHARVKRHLDPASGKFVAAFDDAGEPLLEGVAEYQRQDGDHPLTRYLMLEELTDEAVKTLGRFGLVDKQVRKPLEEAKALNASDPDDRNDRLVAAGAGSRGRSSLREGFGRES
jgi:hypothetical protein